MQLAQQWCGSSSKAAAAAPKGAHPPAAPVQLETVRHLVGAYGDRAPLVLALASEQPALAQPLVPGHPFLQAEVVYCTQVEGMRGRGVTCAGAAHVLPGDHYEAHTAACDVPGRGGGQRWWATSSEDPRARAHAQAVACARASLHAQHEYCVTVEDFLERRTRLAFLDLQAAKAAAPRVAALMGPLLGWSDAEQRRQAEAARAALDKGFTAGPPVPAGAATAA